MLRFVIGLISGIASVLLGLYLVVPRTEFWEAYTATFHESFFTQSHAGISPQYNYFVGTPLDENMAVPMHNSGMRLMEEIPVLTFEQADFSRVCLQPSWFEKGEHFGSMAVNIYLTPDARQRFGSYLLTKPETEFSFEYEGITLSQFHSNTKKIDAFLAEPTKDDIDGDIWFDVPYSGLVMGVALAHNIASKIEPETCYGRPLAEEIPGYEAIMELYTVSTGSNPLGKTQ